MSHWIFRTLLKVNRLPTDHGVVHLVPSDVFSPHARAFYDDLRRRLPPVTLENAERILQGSADLIAAMLSVFFDECCFLRVASYYVRGTTSLAWELRYPQLHARFDYDTLFARKYGAAFLSSARALWKDHLVRFAASDSDWLCLLLRHDYEWLGHPELADKANELRDAAFPEQEPEELEPDPLDRNRRRKDKATLERERSKLKRISERQRASMAASASDARSVLEQALMRKRSSGDKKTGPRGPQAENERSTFFEAKLEEAVAADDRAPGTTANLALATEGFKTYGTRPDRRRWQIRSIDLRRAGELHRLLKASPIGHAFFPTLIDTASEEPQTQPK